MGSPRPIAYNVLGVDGNAEKGLVEFMDALLQLEEDLSSLESDLANQTLDTTGYRLQKDMEEFERRFISLANEISTAKDAIHTHNLLELERYDGDHHTMHSENELITHIDVFLEQIEHLENIAGRVSGAIQTKTNTANSRLIATISAVAVVISVIALLVSIVSTL